MATAAPQARMTPDEYLAFERASETKHEFADGEIFAMSGGTFEHSRVTANLALELGIALKGRPCGVMSPDMRVMIASRRRYVYPDGSVVCGRPQFRDETRDTLLNPKLVFEVLSESSEAYDRGDKFAQYRSLESLREYVLASQSEPRLEVFTRADDGSWVLRVYGPGQRAALPSLDVSVAVDDVYARVFEQPEPAEG